MPAHVEEPVHALGRATNLASFLSPRIRMATEQCGGNCALADLAARVKCFRVGLAPHCAMVRVHDP